MLNDISNLEPVDYDPFDQSKRPQPLVDMTNAARAGQLGTLSADNPSWGDRLAGGFSNAIGMLGAPTGGQRNAYDIGQTMTGLIPGISNAVSGNQAYRDFSQGNYLSGAINTAAALPIPGSGILGKEARPLADVLKSAAEPIGGKVALEGGTPGLLAYHGSRHDFPTFDMSKIGTGEGAQFYGHGLYFAEHPDVAESYRTAGSQGQNKMFDPHGAEYDLPINNTDPHSLAVQYAKYGGSFQDGHEWIDLAQGKNNPLADAAHDHLDRMEKEGYTLTKPKSSKYQVSIGHDPDTFLDLDKQFKDQHPSVQKAVTSIVGRKPYPEMMGSEIHDHIAQRMEGVSQEQTGKFNADDPYVAASNALRDKGVPGIKYLDEGSRHTEPGIDTALNLGDHPQKVQDKVMRIVPNVTPDTNMGDVHVALWTHLLDTKYPGSDTWDSGVDKEATSMLTKAGVPAYEPKKTYNYIVNSDKHINILKKYLIPGAGAAGAIDVLQNHPDIERHQLEEQD